MPLSSSDHILVACVQKVNHQRFQTKLSDLEIIPSTLKSNLKNFDMSPLYKIDNFNLMWEFLQNILIDLVNKHVPIISKCVKGTLY